MSHFLFLLKILDSYLETILIISHYFFEWCLSHEIFFNPSQTSSIILFLSFDCACLSLWMVSSSLALCPPSLSTDFHISTIPQFLNFKDRNFFLLVALFSSFWNVPYFCHGGLFFFSLLWSICFFLFDNSKYDYGLLAILFFQVVLKLVMIESCWFTTSGVPWVKSKTPGGEGQVKERGKSLQFSRWKV